MNTNALSVFLEPIEKYFLTPGITEICINKPEEIWIEKYGCFTSYKVKALSKEFLLQFAGLVAEFNHREISSEHPILSSILPDGSRVQFVLEPACEKGTFICSIRRHSNQVISLESYFKNDYFRGNTDCLQHAECLLLEYYSQKQYVEFLKLAVLSKKNIIISGGTSTGKTTVLNSLLKYIPETQRIITIETDREVKSNHPNSVHLLASQDGKSVAEVTMLDLLKAALRLRPDRLLISELRSDEAFPFLRAVNSGHPGSITTLHADSAEGCFEQLAFMSLQNNSSLKRVDIIAFARAAINIVVQVKRAASNERYISEIYYDKAHELSQPCGAMQD